MNNLSEIFANANIKLCDCKNEEPYEYMVKCNAEVDFLERWLKMLERNASDKERYNFLVKYGFLSEQHFLLYTKCKYETIELEQKVDEQKELYINLDLSLIKRLNEAKDMEHSIKNIYFYRMTMNMFHKKDVSPYGNNVLKF